MISVATSYSGLRGLHSMGSLVRMAFRAQPEAMDLSDAQDSSFNSDVSAPLRLLGTGEFDSLLGLYDTSYPDDATPLLGTRRRRSATFSASSKRSSRPAPAISEPLSTTMLPRSILRTDAPVRTLGSAFKVRIDEDPFGFMRANEEQGVGGDDRSSTVFSTLATSSTLASAFSGVAGTEDSASVRGLPAGHRDSHAVFTMRSRARALRAIDPDDAGASTVSLPCSPTPRPARAAPMPQLYESTSGGGETWQEFLNCGPPSTRTTLVLTQGPAEKGDEGWQRNMASTADLFKPLPATPDAHGESPNSTRWTLHKLGTTVRTMGRLLHKSKSRPRLVTAFTD